MVSPRLNQNTTQVFFAELGGRARARPIAQMQPKTRFNVSTGGCLRTPSTCASTVHHTMQTSCRLPDKRAHGLVPLSRLLLLDLTPLTHVLKSEHLMFECQVHRIIYIPSCGHALRPTLPPICPTVASKQSFHVFGGRPAHATGPPLNPSSVCHRFLGRLVDELT